jgi:hypothetical protein
VAAVEALLGVGDLLEFAAVEEDPSAALTLLDVHATPVDGMHPVLTLRTDHPEEGTGERAIRRRGWGVGETYLDHWRAVLTEGIKTGDFREVDLALVESLFGVFIFTFIWQAPEATGKHLTAVIMDVLLHGVLANR